MEVQTLHNRLGYKVGVGIGIVASLFIGTLLFTLIELRNVVVDLEQLLNQNKRFVEASTVVRSKLNNMMVAERDWIITQEPGYRLQRKQIWAVDLLPATNTLSLFRQKDIKNLNEKEINQIIRSIYAVNNLSNQMENMNDPEKIKDLFYTKVSPISLKLRTQLNALIENQWALERNTLNKNHANIANTFIIDAGLLIIALILCGLLSVVLTRTMTTPLRQLVSHMNALARGDFKQTVDIKGASEFEELSQAFNRVISTLQELADVTSTMAEGDYSHRVQVKSEKDILGIAVNAMLDDFNQIVEQANAIAEGDYRSDIHPRSTIDMLGKALLNMTNTLRENHQHVIEQNWLNEGLANLVAILSDPQDLLHLCQQSISGIARQTKARSAALYLLNAEKQLLQLSGGFALSEQDSHQKEYRIGEGIIGQVGLEQRPLSIEQKNTGPYALSIDLPQKQAQALYAFPLVYEKHLIGVGILAWDHTPVPLIYQYILSMVPILSGHIQAAHQQALTEALLAEQKRLTEKLTAQQEELKVTNEELEEQTQILKASEEELRLKDEEQKKINRQLAERTRELEQNKTKIEATNNALENASKELKRRAYELTKASQYKSEFLANMSHELRTPLNSLLILAKLLCENQDKNLTEDQIESAKIIYNSGQGLLTLINDILDLAKVEAGKITLQQHTFSTQELLQTLQETFNIIAINKGITFITELGESFPDTIYTDQLRLTQILRNLCANSIKFTDHGSVTVRMEKKCDSKNTNTKQESLVFEVKDTGIGIPEDKQAMIFEAFQQADGSTTRKYGGTGLGLSISRELSHLLGGYITVKSKPDKGSTFTLYLPYVSSQDQAQLLSDETTLDKSQPASSITTPTQISSIKKLLIIEDDNAFAQVMMTISRKHGYQCKHLTSANQALATAIKEKPDAILLDISLPGMDGLMLLEQLKSHSHTKNIPVQVISASDLASDAIKKGAIGYLTKPITKEQLDRALDSIAQHNQHHIKNLLIIEDNADLVTAITQLFQKTSVAISVANTGQEALAQLKQKTFDAIILDLGLPDMTGEALLHEFYNQSQDPYPAIIIFTGKQLSDKETEQLNTMVDSIVIKGSSASIERLLEETDLFLYPKGR